MSDDYRVAPEALDRMARSYVHAADEWALMIDVLDGPEATLGEHDLGLIGQWAGFPQAYNDVREAAVKELKAGQEALAASGATLTDVARHYEEKDFEFYRKFGYIQEELPAGDKAGGRQRERSR